MFNKKMVILALAALMVLSPMAALAVNWSEVQQGLKTDGIYVNNPITAVKNGDAINVESMGDGATIENLCLTDSGSYTFGGTITIVNATDKPLVLVENKTGEAKAVEVIVEKGVTIQSPAVSIKGTGNVDLNFINYGTIITDKNPDDYEVYFVAEDGARVAVVNHGTIYHDVLAMAESSIGEASEMIITNDGTMDNLTGDAEKNSATYAFNNGQLSTLSGIAFKGGTTFVRNSETGTVKGSMMSHANGDGSTVTAVNDGNVGEQLYIQARDDGSLDFTNNGKAPFAGLVVVGGNLTFSNPGEIGSIAVREEESAGTVTFVVRAPNSGVTNTDTLKTILPKVTLNNNISNTTIQVVTTDANGNKTARYVVKKDGTLELVKDIDTSADTSGDAGGDASADIGSLPQTGDTSAMALWLALLTLSGVSLLALRRKTAS